MQSVAEIVSGQAPPAAGEILRQEFGALELQRAAETSAAALAEREKATIQAMFIMAMQRPRNVARFEAGILSECERPGFADIARYRKPVGKEKNEQTGEWEQKYAEGWSIRFAEAAMRHWTNLFCDAKSSYEDDSKRIVRMVVMDLESNVTISSELNLTKRVERKGFKKKNALEVTPPEGREVLGSRKNSYGDTVFIVTATDDELNMKQASHWSKFIRNVTKFMPGDILDKCEARIEKTLENCTDEASIDKMLMKFESIGVKEADIQDYLGHSVRKVSKKEVAELRKSFTAIKDGETSWADVVAAHNPTTPDKETRTDVLRANVEALVRAGNIDGARKLAEDTGVDFKQFEETKIQNPQQENGGARTADSVATDSASGKTKSPAGDRNNSEIPPSTGPGSTERPLPTEPRHFPELRAWRETVGDAEFFKIIGPAGFETLEQVTANAWPDIEQALIDRAKDLNKTKAEKPATKKGFGGLGGKK